MQHQPEPQPSTVAEVTLGDLIAVAFDRAEEVSSEPDRVAVLATCMVAHNLAWSPRNAATSRELRRVAREWEAS